MDFQSIHWLDKREAGRRNDMIDILQVDYIRTLCLDYLRKRGLAVGEPHISLCPLVQVLFRRRDLGHISKVIWRLSGKKEANLELCQ